MAARLLQNNSSSLLSIGTPCFSSIFCSFPKSHCQAVPSPVTEDTPLELAVPSRRDRGKTEKAFGRARRTRGSPKAGPFPFHGVFLCRPNFQKHLSSLTPQGSFICLSSKRLSSWEHGGPGLFPSGFPVPPPQGSGG